MTREARALELLRRLSEWAWQSTTQREYMELLNEARTLLAEQASEPVWAVARAEFRQRSDGSWMFTADPHLAVLRPQFSIRVAVPPSVLNPRQLTGEVLGDAGKEGGE